MMPAWNDAQINRFNFRQALFQRRGVDLLTAEALADKLATRDYERDDRRMCLECKHIQRSGACFEASQGRLKYATRQHAPVRDILFRCDGFSFQTP